MALLSSWHFKLPLVGAWLLLVARSTLAAMTPFSAIDPILQGCTDEDAAHVRQAWKEAGDLANVHYEWSPGGAWQAAMDLYLGNATRKDYDFWGDPGPLVAGKYFGAICFMRATCTLIFVGKKLTSLLL